MPKRPEIPGNQDKNRKPPAIDENAPPQVPSTPDTDVQDLTQSREERRKKRLEEMKELDPDIYPLF
jgi:hypothetical protein